MLRRIVLISIILTFGVFNVVSEEIDRQFFQAFEEIKEMLEEAQPLSVKRAAFLLEWAYLDSMLSYESYCQGIDTTVIAINS